MKRPLVPTLAALAALTGAMLAVPTTPARALGCGDDATATPRPSGAIRIVSMNVEGGPDDTNIGGTTMGGNPVTTTYLNQHLEMIAKVIRCLEADIVIL